MPFCNLNTKGSILAVLEFTGRYTSDPKTASLYVAVTIIKKTVTYSKSTSLLSLSSSALKTSCKFVSSVMHSCENNQYLEP